MHRLHPEPQNKEEKSQRTRSLLLLLLGAVIALTQGCNELEIYENGLECFGFPCNPMAHAAQESRAMHPIFLYRLSQWLTTLTGKPFRFVAPNLFKTKSDLLKNIPVEFQANLWEQTLSCMHFPQRRGGARQCGCCSGCILRQLAFSFNGLPEPRDDYRYEANYDKHSQSGKNSLRLSDYSQMRGQVNLLNRALRQPDKWNALMDYSGIEPALVYLELEAAMSSVTKVTSQDGRYNVVCMFERYVREWENVFGLEPH